jgi:hypothetical protein
LAHSVGLPRDGRNLDCCSGVSLFFMRTIDEIKQFGFWSSRWRSLCSALVLAAATPRVIPQPNLETCNGCGMKGDASSPAVRELNLLRNRYTAPEPRQIDPRVTLAAMLEPGGDRIRWNDHHATEITGYLWDVKVGGVETVNCHAADPPERYAHIELVHDPRNGCEDHRVIVEVTPRSLRTAR